MSVTKLVCLSLLLCALAVDVQAQGRRVRLRARPAPISEDQLQYYEAEPRASDQEIEEEQDLSLYGRQAPSRADYRPNAIRPRTKEAPRAPPVQTIRNYNKVNDDGSFTFGYEAADGSFKEETRGTDCVVRGKYGYVDPDGNKREFTYVSGNPCDPNAANEEEEEKSQEESNEAAGEPANYPSRPANYPTRPVANYPTRSRPQQTTPRPATTVFQNLYSSQVGSESESDSSSSEEDDEPPRTRAPRPQSTPLAITPRPLPPATTFRPHLLQIPQRPTPVPQVVYSSSIPQIASSTPSFESSSYRPSGHIDFAAEFAKFQQENQIVSSTPATYKTKAKASEQVTSSGNPIYSTQLVYDPSSGQYDTRLFQSLPQSSGGLTLNQRVPRPTSQPQLGLQQPQGFNAPVYRQRQQPQVVQQLRSPQEVYQRQQAGLQFQNSAQLYAQQQQLQQSQLQQDRQLARAQLIPQPQQQQFYYVSPNRDQQTGPIDAFLRGQGLTF